MALESQYFIPALDRNSYVRENSFSAPKTIERHPFSLAIPPDRSHLFFE
jgi:hypothetical protein